MDYGFTSGRLGYDALRPLQLIDIDLYKEKLRIVSFVSEQVG